MFVPKGFVLVFYACCSGKVHSHAHKKVNENYSYSMYDTVDVRDHSHYTYLVCGYVTIHVI